MSRKDAIENLSVQEALKLKDGSVRRAFPGDYLESSVREVMRDAALGAKARTALKLLLANEYDKKK